MDRCETAKMIEDSHAFVGQCWALESGYPDFDASEDAVVYTNTGYILTNRPHLLLDICSRPLTRRVCRVTFHTDVGVGGGGGGGGVNADPVVTLKRVADVRKNLILTNGYQLSHWKDTLASRRSSSEGCTAVEQEAPFLIHCRRLLTARNVERYDTLIIPIGLVARREDAARLFGSVRFGRIFSHNIGLAPVVQKLGLDCAFRWMSTSDLSEIPDDEVGGRWVVRDSNCVPPLEVSRRDVLSHKPIESVTLHGLVEHIVTDSIDTYDIKRVIKHLASPEIRNEKDVIRLVLRRLNNELRMVDENEISINRMEYANEDDRRARLRALEESRVSIRHRKDELVKRITENNLCFICYSPIEVKAVLRCCANVVCLECIEKWLHHRNACPLCKTESSKLYIVQEDTGEEENGAPQGHSTLAEEGMSVKKNIFVNFRLLLNEIFFKGIDNAAQVVVVTSDGPIMQNRFFKIAQCELGVSCARLKGNQGTLAKVVEGFETGHVRVLFIDQRTIVYPMRLTRATDVVYILDGTRPTWDILPCLKRRWIMKYAPVGA